MYNDSLQYCIHKSWSLRSSHSPVRNSYHRRYRRKSLITIFHYNTLTVPNQLCYEKYSPTYTVVDTLQVSSRGHFTMTFLTAKKILHWANMEVVDTSQHRHPPEDASLHIHGLVMTAMGKVKTEPHTFLLHVPLGIPCLWWHVITLLKVNQYLLGISIVTIM